MKYYLVNYSITVSGGTMIFPHRCRMFALTVSDPLKCYEYIKGEIDRELNKPFDEEATNCGGYHVVITDMKRID